jgi:outer membrane protein assembly factor BamB
MYTLAFIQASLIPIMIKFVLMKILFLILLLGLQRTFCQSDNIVVITNPEIGLKANAVNLNAVVEDINKRQNISGVVVIGNITANGKFDEFIWAQEILDQLSVHYFVVGGERDYLHSEENGAEFSMIWGDEKQLINSYNFSLIGLNTFIPQYPRKQYLDSETIFWMENQFNASQIPRLFTFSYYPLSNTENSNKLFEITTGRKIFSFVGKLDNSTTGKSNYEGLYLNRKEGWGYLLISTKKDSIFIKKIISEEIKNKVKPEIVKTAFSKVTSLSMKKPTSYISAGSKIWSLSLNKVKITSSVSDGEYIYSVFKDGLVNCIDVTGKEIWHFETNKKISIPPLIENELLVVASDDGEIITLNAKTGTSYQIIGIGEKITSGIAFSNIENQGINGKTVIAGTEYSNLYCYDLNSLNPIWTEQISGINQELNVCSEIVSSNNKIFFYDNEGTLYCLSSSNGMLIWKLAYSGTGWKINKKSAAFQHMNDLVLLGNDLFFVDSSGSIFCIDALLGIVKWNIKNISAVGVIIFNSNKEIILPTTKNKILTISTRQGKVLSEIELPFETNNRTITDIEVIGNNIVIGFNDGWIYKLKLKQKVEKFFRASSAPVISLEELNGNCLVTDYDGNFILLNLSKK